MTRERTRAPDVRSSVCIVNGYRIIGAKIVRYESGDTFAGRRRELRAYIYIAFTTLTNRERKGPAGSERNVYGRLNTTRFSTIRGFLKLSIKRASKIAGEFIINPVGRPTVPVRGIKNKGRTRDDPKSERYTTA